MKKRTIAFLLGIFLFAACSRVQTGSYEVEPPVRPIGTGSVTPNSASLLDNLDPASIYRDPTLKFERLSVADGLSQSVVNSGLQDQYGFLWFGTDDGLNRYDGYNFKIYRNDPDDAFSLNNNIILSMLEDSSGEDIWLGTEQGLSRFHLLTGRTAAFTHVDDDPRSLSNDVVNAIFRDSGGRLWIGTEAGLNLFDDDKESFTVFDNIKTETSVEEPLIVHAITEDGERLLWLATNRGLLRFDPVEKTFADIPASLATLFISERLTALSLLYNHKGELWIGTIGGLYRLSADGDQVTLYQHHENQPQSIISNRVNTVFEDRLGLIWAGTDLGLALYDPSLDGFHNYEPNPERMGSLSGASINAIMQDRSGLLWFMTENGINQLDLSAKRFEQIRYVHPEGKVVGTDMVYDIQQDAFGDLWFGSANGLIRFDPDRNVYYRYINNPMSDTSLSYNQVLALLLDATDRLWVGTSEGGVNLYYPPENNFLRFTNDPLEENSLSSRMVSIMYQDQAGNIWIGYNDGRLDMLNRDRNKVARYVLTVPGSDRQRRNRIRALVEDHLGLIWAGTAYGLYSLDPKNGAISRIVSTPNKAGSLSDDYVTALHADQNGTLWVGTYGGGLNRYNRTAGTFTSYRIKDGLPNDSIYGILEDNQGRLWISTNLGVTCFDPRMDLFRNLDEQDGLQSNVFNEYAFYRNDAGKMFFGGINGITAFYPIQIEDNPFIPNVVLTSFRQGERVFNPQTATEGEGDIVIRWPDNYFEFEFVVLNYRQPAKNLYAYRLEGFESDWNVTGNRRYGRYTNLPGGDYELHLIGSNDDGVWNTTGTSVRIRVVPPVWETTGFQIAAILLIALGGGTGYLLKVRSVQVRNRQLAAQVDERTREIEQRRQVADGLRGVFILLNSSKPLEESLGFIQKQVLRLAGARFAWIFQLTGSSGVRVKVLAPGPEDVPAYLSENVIEWFAQHVREKQSRLVADWGTLTSRAPQLSDPSLKWIRTVVCTPIIPEREVFGGLVAFFDEVKRFSEEEVNLLNSFAEQASLAVGNQWLRAKAEEIAVVTERTRLARDLHDAVTQTLFSASLIAEALPRMWENNPDEGHKLLGELRQLNRGALAEMRSLLMELRPAAVVEARLCDLIRQLAESVSGRTGMRIKIQQMDECRLPDEIHLGFYRIAQEALTNVVKHARAKNVRLTLSCTPMDETNHKDTHQVRVSLEIQDDGCGFDPENITPDHFGLENIRDRARSIGADIVIASKPDKGTRIQLSWEGEEALDE